MIDVVIADDQAMVRSGIRVLLEEHEDIRVTAEAADGEQAVAAVRRHRPHVVLMDIRMPTMDGITATRLIVHEGSATRTVVLTTFDLDEYVFAALRAGASGFLLKDATAEQLVETVRVVAAGNSSLAPAVTRRVIEAFASTTEPDPALLALRASLTVREIDVLRKLAAGHSNADIARLLYLGESTVKTHVSNLLAKLEIRDRVQAVIFAYESGLVRAGDPAGDS